MSTEEMERSSSETIANAKNVIKKVFAEIESNGDSYKRYPELEQGTEIDVENYRCSVCGLEDAPRNDILFCDKAGCNRVYHQKCVDPPIVSLNTLVEDDDWFCPICDCIDDCLEMVNDAFETSHTNWTQIFPEIEGNRSDQNWEGSDGEEDESYAPSIVEDKENYDSMDDISRSVDSFSEASADGNEDNLSTIDQEELNHLLLEKGGGDTDHRLRRRSKPEIVDVMSQFEAPHDIVSQHVAKSIKGYLLRGQVIGYTPSDPDSSAILAFDKSPLDSGLALGWDGLWTVQYEYEKNPCQVSFGQLKNALELYLEYDRKVQMSDESQKRQLHVHHHYSIYSDIFSFILVEIRA